MPRKQNYARKSQAMAFCGMLFKQLLFGLLISAAAAAPETNPSCNRRCGSLSIPYPFGTSEDCYLNRAFLITCNYTFNPPKPFVGKGTVEVLNISLKGELRVLNSVAWSCINGSSYRRRFKSGWLRVSNKKNKFTALGCNTVGFINGTTTQKNYTTGCVSRFDNIGSVVNGSCNGMGCCHSPIPEDITYFQVSFSRLFNESGAESLIPCSFGFLVEEEAYNFSSLDLTNFQGRKKVPLVLDWAVGEQTCLDAQKNRTTYACKAKHSECLDSSNTPGYICLCPSNYEGNPYLPDGCKDTDECKRSNPCDREQECINLEGGFDCLCPEGSEKEGNKSETFCRPKGSNSRILAIALSISIGLLVLLTGSFCIYWGLERRQLIKLRKKLFQQNGGLILQEQLSNYKEKLAKIFTVEELKRATNNYDESRILGQGGNGIVYKGLLTGNKVVAIKKSKTFDRSQIKQFINEVFLLTQINHRNVVKLLGCCLETEVPLLVYELITNGTLFYHIHENNRSSFLSWEKRLKIAAEIAGAIAYLHSEASMPIIHRDVKSANILLDDNLIAKVADFGASRQISIGEKQATTLVQGTHGYLDPESFQTGLLTDKSDVYSFGVVLAELLTSMKVIFSDKTGSDANLAMYFASALKNGQLLQILDTHIIHENNIEEIKEVANIAKACLSASGEDRPSMKEVSMELEGLRIMKTQLWKKNDLSVEEIEHLLAKPRQCFNIDVGTSYSSPIETVGYDSIRNLVPEPPNDGR